MAGGAGAGTATEDQSGTATRDPAGPATQPDAPAAGSGPAPVTAVPTFTPPGVDTDAPPTEAPIRNLKPAADVAPAGLRSTHRALTNVPATYGPAATSISGGSTGGLITGTRTRAAAQTVASPKMATGPPAAITQVAATSLVQAAALTPQTPTCAVPRNDLNTQVMQPSPAQAIGRCRWPNRACSPAPPTPAQRVTRT